MLPLGRLPLSSATPLGPSLLSAFPGAFVGVNGFILYINHSPISRGCHLPLVARTKHFSYDGQFFRIFTPPGS
jgi:hypothetical protein